MNPGTATATPARIALAALSLTALTAVAGATDKAKAPVPGAGPTISQPYEHSGITNYSLTQRVSFKDLDLATPAGVAELRRRVTESATAVCARLGELFPKVFTTAEECRAQAVESAMVQVRAAIAQATAPASGGAVAGL